MSSIVSPDDINPLEDHDRFMIVRNWSDVSPMATHLAMAKPIQSLAPLRDFPHLRHLRILGGDALLSTLVPLPELCSLRLTAVPPKGLTSLEPLSNVANLERLILHHVPQVRSLRPLAALEKLKDLLIEVSPGSISTLQELDSLQPLAGLRAMERLELRGIRVAELGLRPLEQMTWLRHLVVNNHFEIEDFARLAAALPTTQGFCLHPFVAVGIPCDQCQQEKVMLIGQTRPTIACPQCQAKHVERHVARFQQCKAAYPNAVGP